MKYLLILALLFMSCKKQSMEFWVRHSHTDYLFVASANAWDMNYWYGSSPSDLQPMEAKNMTYKQADKFCRDNTRMIRTQSYDWAYQVDSFVVFYVDENGVTH